MEEIRRVVKAASLRLFMSALLRELAVFVTVGLTGLLLSLFVERLFGLAFPWKVIFYSVAGAAALAAIVSAVARRKDALSVAREVDDRAGLRESLSTAMCVGASEDPWAKAVVETARSRAAEVNVPRAVPVETPKMWPIPLAAGGALALAWFVMPTWDILKTLEKKEDVQRQQQELVTAKADVEKMNQKLDAMLQQAKVEFKDEKPDEAGEGAIKPEDLKNPEEVRRAAVKRLSDVADRLNQMKDSEKAQQMDALKQQMRQLRQSTDGPLHEFQRQLARGNFDQAKQQLEEMAKKMSDGQLSEQDAAKAKQQLEDMAKQLEKIAADKKELEQQLEQQGLSKDQAKDLLKKAASGDPKELQKAMEDLKQLSPEQREALMKQAMAQMKASQQSQQMAENMSKMAQNMQGQQMNQQGMEGMQGMMSELSASEQMSQEMQAAQAAMSEVQAQLASMGQGLSDGEGDGDYSGDPRVGPWKDGDSDKRGSGSGGPGKGLGAGPEAAPTDYGVKKDKANVATQQGPIIGSRLVWGEQIRGESRAAFNDAVESSTKAATEALESMQIPRPYHGAVKKYFGSLQDKGAKSANDAGTKSGDATGKDGAKKDGASGESKNDTPADDAKDGGKGK